MAWASCCGARSCKRQRGIGLREEKPFPHHLLTTLNTGHQGYCESLLCLGTAEVPSARCSSRALHTRGDEFPAEHRLGSEKNTVRRKLPMLTVLDILWDLHFTGWRETVPPRTVALSSTPHLPLFLGFPLYLVIASH